MSALLNSLQSNLESAYIKHRNMNGSATQAAQLERLLNKCIQGIRNVNSRAHNSALVQGVLANLSSSRNIPIEQMFGDYQKNLASGEEFEQDLADLIQAIGVEVQITGKDKATTQSTIVGKKSKALLNANTLVEVQVWAYDQAVKKAVKNWEVKKINEVGDNDIVRIKPASQKGDLKTGGIQVSLMAEEGSELQRLQKLLASANISAKNYTNLSHITLDSSAWGRIYHSVLSQLGYSANIQTRLVSILNDKKNEQAILMRQKLRYIYALTGAGQYIDINGNMQYVGGVNFLIVFSKTTGTVKVISTQSLLNKYLSGEKIPGKGQYIKLN